VRKQKRNKEKEEQQAPNLALAPAIQTKCSLCGKHWDRYVGKKKCSTCGVPVVMCDTCMSSRPKDKQLHLARCPLCIEEHVTVRVEDVEWTNNGVDNKSKAKKKRGGTNIDAEPAKSSAKQEQQHDEPPPKVAPSVLKWGGGHASQKKEKRRWARTPCRFGTDCVRKDCFFAHPTKSKTQSHLAQNSATMINMRNVQATSKRPKCASKT
jgi:hypothetical protein